MRPSKFQCSALFSVMMVAVVYSVSVHNCTNKAACDILLKDICKLAYNLTKLNASEWVPKLFNPKCGNKFFCLAEKVLEHIVPKTPVTSAKQMRLSRQDKEKLEKLKRQLHQYNNKTNETNCTLNTTAKYRLTTFLQDVKTCTHNACKRIR